MTNRSQEPCPIEVFPRLTSPIDRNLFKGEPAPMRKMTDDVVRLWAKLRIRVKSLAHELSDRRIEAAGVGIPLEHPIQDRSGHATSIGRAPSKCRKQGSRPRPPICRCRGRGALEQFGCGISRGSRYQTGLSQARLVLSHGDTEIDENRPLRGTNDIRGLHIAVDNPTSMNILKGLGKRPADRRNPSNIDRTARE